MSAENVCSVYFTIIDLCKNIYAESNPTKILNNEFARKLKSKCFEILLKKSTEFPENNEKDCDIEKQFAVELFKFRSRTYLNPARQRDFQQFEKYIQNFLKDSESKEIETNVLLFLLKIQDSVAGWDELEESRSKICMPGPFTLYGRNVTNFIHSTNTLRLPRPEKTDFQIPILCDLSNPYLPRALFYPESSELIKIGEKYGTAFQRSSGFSANEPEDTYRSALRISPLRSQISKTPHQNQVANSKSKLNWEYKNTSVIQKDNESITSSNFGYRIGWAWEHLGSSIIPIHAPFSSESNTVLHLNQVLAESSGTSFSANIVSVEVFIANLKTLAVGIQSDLFQCDDLLIFHMTPNITIDGVSPQVIKFFVLEFIECGSCFKRLQALTTKSNYKPIFDGFIFKALCTAVDEYLVLLRHVIVSLECKTLLEFSWKMKTFMNQIVVLAKVLYVHPKVDASPNLPIGSQFLLYLYKEITKSTQNDILMLLIYILRKCCHVYFRYLQKWIYYGILDDPCNELFIYFVDHYRPYTKHFYDKAYFVRKESVPGFFQGFEEQVLQCGKYAMLLKSFKPNHPLFSVGYPPISVCLSFEEIDVVTKNCKKYSEKVRRICGHPICIQDIYNKRRQRRNTFCELVSQNTKKNIEKWRVDQIAKVKLVAAEKRKRFLEMENEIKTVRERKLAEKEENIQLERKLLMENEKIEAKRIEKENMETEKRIAHYKMLNAIINERKEKAQQDLLKVSPELEHAPASPSSVATDFESCCGDDVESNYEECISDNVIEKLPAGEKHLQKYDTENEHNDLLNVNNVQEVLMAKSPSDYFNSNELPLNTNVISESRRNQNKIMGSNIDFLFNETQVIVDISKPLTEAQKNKLKVQMEEFGNNVCDNVPADINFNPVMTNPGNLSSISVLSDVEINRRKMMSTDILNLIPSEPKARNFHLDLTTERYKNRKKVLESEFNIFIDEKIATDTTPMSTTSDVSEECGYLDKNNPKLTIDINATMSIDIDNMQLDIPTAVIEETPECALNTAGIAAKVGFDFSKSEKKTTIAAPTQSTVVVQNQEKNNNNENVFWRIGLYSYDKFEQLLETNTPITPFISLKSMEFQNTSDVLKKFEDRKSKFDGLSTITLTEFLQKSATIPIITHLEILNDEVMRIFLTELDIVSHFKSLRNYFFLMDGEFGGIICDGLIAKLERGSSPNELLNYQRLHSILENALGSSMMGNDKNSKNLSFYVCDVPEKFDFNSPGVFDNLTLSYSVEWPLNLILNPETLQQYGNIFKYLMKVRRISWVLEDSCQILKQVAKKYGNDILISPQYRKVQQIRHKFLHFIHALKNHITSSALQASWKTFRDELISSKTIEELYRKHTAYIKRIIFLCMLNRRSADFYNNVENIFKISLRFYRNLKSREWKKHAGAEHFTHSRYEKLLNDEDELEKLIKYTIYLGNKIVQRGYQEEIGEFINLINFNYYYVVNR